MIDAQTLNYFATIGLGIIGYLLKQKDEKQAKEIEELRTETSKQHVLLWQKHEQDAKELADLRLHIASQHYVKAELDARFDKMEAAFTHGFQDLGSKMDKMISVIVKDK